MNFRKNSMVGAVLALVAGTCAVAAQEIESVYTDLAADGTGCVTIGSDMISIEQSCQGHAGYGLLVSDVDLRVSVFFGYVGAWYAEGAYESFSSFNSVGDTVEWRLVDRVPRAAILRWLVDFDGSGDPETRGQVLVVSKVAQPGVGEGCVVGYVDARANDDANELARMIADDMAEAFTCRVDEPEFHGKTGLATPTPVRSFGP